MMDTSALAFPKAPPSRDKKYLAFVREQICAVVGNACGGVTEAAHLSTTGRGMKSGDFLTVPLCSKHHAASHQVGFITFQINEGIDLWEVCARLQAKWMGMTR